MSAGCTCNLYMICTKSGGDHDEIGVWSYMYLVCGNDVPPRSMFVLKPFHVFQIKMKIVFIIVSFFIQATVILYD